MLLSLCWARTQAHEYVEYPAPTTIDNPDMFMKLALWDTLDQDTKLRVSQWISHLEANHLGLPTMKVVIDSSLSERTIANYYDIEHLISFNSLYLDDMQKCCIAVLHEARHNFQYRMSEIIDELDEKQKALLLISDFVIIRRELYEDYIHGYDDSIGHYFQLVEQDSRAYADERFSTAYRIRLPAVSPAA